MDVLSEGDNEEKGIACSTVPQTCHSGECRNPGVLMRSFINQLLDTGIRRYDAIPVFEFYTQELPVPLLPLD